MSDTGRNHRHNGNNHSIRDDDGWADVEDDLKGLDITLDDLKDPEEFNDDAVDDSEGGEMEESNRRSETRQSRRSEDDNRRRRSGNSGSGHRDSGRGGRRDRGKNDNPAREWFSDNLRYILLIAVLALVIILIVFIIRRVNNGSGSTANTNEAVTATSTVSTVGSVSGTSGESVTASSDTTSSSEDTTQVTAATSLDIDTSVIQLEQADTATSDVVTAYFNNLLSTEVNPAIESYSQITTYVYPVDGGTIAFAQYTYKYKDFEENIPALTELYIVNGQIVDQTTADQDQQMDDAANSAEAATLISQVRSAYDSVIASDPALESYINNLQNTGDSSSTSSEESVSSSSGTADASSQG